MPLDTARAAFVQNEYRYSISEDLSIKANYPNAIEMVNDTQLGAADAATLASGLLAALKNPGQLYEIEIDAAIMGDDFATALPRYVATFPEFAVSGKTVRVVSAETDYLAQRTKIVVRT